MRVYSPATAAYFDSRQPFMGHLLVYVWAQNRQTGAEETIGFWTGADHQEFAIEGAARLYFGAGSLLAMDPIRRQTGLKVRTHRLTLSQIAPETEMLFRGYEPRQAPIEVHRALCDPVTEALIDAPHEIVCGYIDKAKITTPAKGGSGNVVVEIASEARALTKPLSRYRSDATLRARSGSDAWRQYALIADSVDTPWGREDKSRQAEERPRSDARPGSNWDRIANAR